MEGGSHTVYDIARLAGVSPATVSRVLTGVVRVSPEKESRIRAVMEQVNFRPNAFARTLLRKRSLTLGVIMPDITNLFFSQTFLELERAAFHRGYSLLLGNTLNSDRNPDRDLEAFYLNSLHERQVDGIILMGGRINDTEMDPRKRDELVKLNRHKPLITINGKVAGTEIAGVRSREEDGIRELVDHLCGLGHRDFALLGGVVGITAFDLKKKALEEALAARNLTLNPHWVLPTDFSLQAGALATERLLAQPRRPTAIVGVNDFVAVGAIRAAASAGLKVPGDFSVTGFDDILTSEFLVPSLTSVNHQYQALAEAAVDVLIAKIEGQRAPEETLIEIRSVFRESTSAPRF